MISDKVFQEAIKWKLHSGQKEVVKSKTRERVICAGRRWGKSAVCGYIVAKTFIGLFKEIKEGARDSVKIWIVAPTYELARKVFRYTVIFLRKVEPNIDSFIKDRPVPQIKITEDVWIQCKSATEPKSLLGEGLDLLIVDEAANISKRIWYDYLLPTTASKTRKGKTIFISTPRGKNWFYDLYLRAKEEKGAFHFTSLDGVEINKEEWDRLKGISPSDFFEQNYEATFLEEAAAVFRGIRDIIKSDCLREPEPGHRYIMGVDLAQIKDFTVITIADKSTHNVVYWSRFKKIKYPLQIERIENVARKYNARIIIDVNNIGLSIADELKARGLRVEDFKMVGTISKDLAKRGSKERLINKLSLDIENKDIYIPPKEVLIDELESFSYRLTPSRNLQYGAPEGYHDDCVISLALANWGLKGKTKREKIEARRSRPHFKRKFEYY